MRARHDARGFTLLEILIVVMIVGLLMSFVATRFLSRTTEAKIRLAETQLRQLQQALELYKLDNGRYPTHEQGLDALAHEPTSEPVPRHYPSGGYLETKQLRDPWDNPVQYSIPGEHNAHSYDLFSYGPDGTEGGEGENKDIVNWEEVTG
jgi:general secretion pathway protein G